MSDELDELFSREEVLGGLHGSQAKRLLFWIETHTAHMVSEARDAIKRFLGEVDAPGAAPDAIKELALTLQDRKKVTIENLERYAPHWQSLVPENPKSRAALIRLFGRKYNFSYDSVPRLRTALGMDKTEVEEAYKALYHKSLETIFKPPESPIDIQPEPTSSEATLDRVSLEEIEAELEWVRLLAGETLFRQGEIGDSLYILINGRLRSVVRPADDEGEIVRDIGHDDIVGETSLMVGVAYASTIYAVRDSELIRFSRQSLERLAEKYPIFMMHLMRRLARLLYTATSRPVVSSNLKAIALVPANAEVPLVDFTHRLVERLKKTTATLHLTAHILDEALGAGVAQSEPNSADSSRIAGWLSQQEAKYDLLIYEAEAEPSNWTRRCIRQADRVLIVAEGAANPEPGQIELEILGLEEAHISPSCELVLLYPDRNRQPVNTYRWLASRRVIRHHHLDLNAEADFDRLVRFLTGNAIGIVFSGGLFRGFAHGGVIRALEEAKIRADFVGGTSIGAAIGALYAMEWPFEKLLQRGKAFAAGARSYIDFTLPLVSLISSGKLTRLTQELYGETRIEDLWTNYFCVSGNLTTAQAMIHRQGPLWRYVRASYSLPTVMPPVPDNGEILVDGSLFNNLPADTMRDLCEGGPVIAVNVSPKKELPKQYKFDEKISAQRLLWSRFNPFVEELKAPSLLSTLMRSMVIGREETWPQAARDIDLYIEPPVVQFDLGDISSLDKIIEASYQAATVEIESWQKKLRERGILR